MTQIRTRSEFRAFVALLARRMPRGTETEAVVYLIDRAEQHMATTTDPARLAALDQWHAAALTEVGPAMDRDHHRDMRRAAGGRQ